MFENYIEINMVQDFEGLKLFEKVKTVEDFYLQVSMIAGDRMKEKENTLIFIDEIQVYPHLITMLKFLKEDDKFNYIASGLLLGVTLSETTSIPIGSIERKSMYPLDFEEFILSQGFNSYAINALKNKFERRESLDENIHEKLMELFKKYLLTGGLPDAVNSYIKDKNIINVRTIQSEIHSYYGADASKYDTERKLKIRRIYDQIPSNLENKKKRVVIQNIEKKIFGL